MERLNARERELVAIGAAIASNCIPCMEFHIPAAREAGLSDEQILLAIKIAEAIKNVPAAGVRNASTQMLNAKEADVCIDPGCVCHQESDDNAPTDDSPCCS
jgi:4-carboxymuconolactone decarboxylase